MPSPAAFGWPINKQGMFCHGLILNILNGQGH